MVAAIKNLRYPFNNRLTARVETEKHRHDYQDPDMYVKTCPAAIILQVCTASYHQPKFHETL